MNTANARTILAETARLVELTAIFQARYGKAYKVTATSPNDAWKLHHAILDTQHIIANLLDPQILEHPHNRYGKWWDRHDVMEASMAQQLINEVAHLIAVVAHCDANQQDGKATWSHAVNTTQSAIAGILHPQAFVVPAALTSDVQLNAS